MPTAMTPKTTDPILIDDDGVLTMLSSISPASYIFAMVLHL
jgi:hypothetical protein